MKIPIFLLILLLAATLRLYGLNWDQSQHLHPDERMITMVALTVNLPQDLSQWSQVFTPQSILNPHFFAYGSLPIYLLRAGGAFFGLFSPVFDRYDLINLVGRLMSSLFDIGTIVIIYKLAKKFYNSKTALLAAFFYAIAVLPIQLSHFYAVDTLLNFFITLTLYRSICLYQNPTNRNAAIVGLSYGLAMVTKFSALPTIFPMLVSIIILYYRYRSIKKSVQYISIALASTFLILILLQPYMFIDFSDFYKQIKEQNLMTHDAFTFPYTLQYVGKVPYIYELKNIFFWGMGPVLACLGFLGTSLAFLKLFKKDKQENLAPQYILLSYFLVYFAIVGHFAIGFMRYMLPLYPLFCLYAASFVSKLISILPKNLLFYTLYSIFLILVLIWPLAFIHIYSQPSTRILASEWIHQNIPVGSTIAVEHWDDELPLGGTDGYKMQTLTLYDPDTPQKWVKTNQTLQNSTYIIIASNRLYVPLSKLTDCSDLPPGRCYQQTAQYYKQLFSGQLGFTKVTEFSIIPELKVFNHRILINDFNADESFTVYDHPKVMIFKKD